MLGLATHEAYFYILREEVTSSTLQVTRCALCGSDGHLFVLKTSISRVEPRSVKAKSRNRAER